MTNATINTPALDDRPCYVPISKLSVHPGNVRRTDRRADIETLAASIAAHGLLQNLSVIPIEDDRYAVVAGGRRLAALRLLAREGKIARDYAARCTVLDETLSTEASLAENIQRVAMNAMDEMEAFAALADTGMSADDIAVRFGANVRHVEQRLALGRLSPKLRAAYRKAEITLDVARAFCLTDDHAAQERLFKQFGKPITHAGSVRAALAGGRIPATDKLARFVGVDAYEAAGGRIMRDLFEDNVVFLEDGDILQRLAGERIETIRQEVAGEGWGWVEVQLQHGLIEGCASERLRPTARKLSRKESKTIAALEAEIEALDQQLEEADDDDARWQQRDDAETKLDALRQSAQCFDAEQMALAGAVIAIDQSGAPVITRGLIKRGDVKAVRKLQQVSATTDAAAGEDETDETTGPVGPRLPKTLVEDLTKARTRAIRDQLAKSPHIALALAVYVLRERSVGSSSVPGVEIATHPVGYDDVDAFEQWRVQVSEQASDDLAGLIATDDTALSDMLAVFVAETLEFSHQGASPHDARLQRMSDTLASALDLDMKVYWEASVEFWERAPKTFIIDALAGAPPISEMSEAARKVRLTALAKMKKAELARTAAKALQSSGWLPDELITPPCAGSLAVTPQGKAVVANAEAYAA
ncbi:MAG: ParB N-terminal domain-containing protein [Hyphomonadaceae bacterium]|nr:ParB N-terminal domain-containing protein [Hyphomonadaceae bacterium]